MNPLIAPGELAGLLETDPNVVVLDVRWQLSTAPGGGAQREDYLAGHIPTARFVDLERDATNLSVEGQGRHPLPDPAEFQAAMRRVGVRDGVTVVVYDGGSSLAAARLWWLLTDAGLRDVQVLDGGFAAWQREGFDVVGGEDEPSEPTQWVARAGRRQRARMQDLAAMQAAGATVIDVRAAERFRGDSEPLDPMAGHVPGAVNVPIAEVVRPDGTIREASEVRDAFAARAGDVFMCGSGITASLALLAYEASGGVGAMIYPGSWSQWSRAGMPVETGAPGRDLP